MNEPDFVVEEWERDRSRRVTRALPFAGARRRDYAPQQPRSRYGRRPS